MVDYWEIVVPLQTIIISMGMDKIKGVITGDIIGSSDIQIKYRDFLLESIRRIVDELSVIEPIKIEFLEVTVFKWLLMLRKMR